jgi:hypothetical protein
LGNDFAALWGLGASNLAAVVLTSTVGQSLGLAWVASTSGLCSAFDLQSHHHTSLGFYESIEGALMQALGLL